MYWLINRQVLRCSRRSIGPPLELRLREAGRCASRSGAAHPLGAPYPRPGSRGAEPGRMGRAPAARRTLSARQRLPRRRRLPPAPAVRRLRHEHGHRRCGRPGVEAVRGARGVGRFGASRQLRDRAPSGPSAGDRRGRAEPPRGFPQLRSRRHRSRRRRGPAAPSAVGHSIREGKRREFDSLGLMLGSAYDSSPISVADGTPKPTVDPLSFEASARPGCRAPHLWLADGDARCASLFDHFGYRLHAARDASRTCRRNGRGGRGGRTTRRSAACPGAGGRRVAGPLRSRFARIRPDQFVAWRGDRIEDACAAVATASGRASPP